MEIVVKAKFGYIVPNGEVSWQVVEGDTGILQWERHPRFSRFFEPLVAWDRDLDRKPRRVIITSLEMIGVQVERQRVLIVSR